MAKKFKVVERLQPIRASKTDKHRPTNKHKLKSYKKYRGQGR